MVAMHWTVYRSRVSYFSGKLEAFLKYKEVPYSIVELDGPDKLQRVFRHTGVRKVPAMEGSDGSWLFDTTPTIQWLDQEYGGLSVLPDDDALRFLALLIEDYGDEWLWRPSMWWRWVPMGSRRTLGRAIGREMFGETVGKAVGWLFAKRQMREWLWDDGVNKDNEGYVRDMLFREFEFLEPLLEERPFILGSHPTVADYGYFGSMFRHFGNDPDSSEVMRMHAPNTYEWLARLWNAKQRKLGANPRWAWPEGDYWQPLLDRIANDYLPYLKQNANAYRSGKKRFDFTGKNVSFPNTKTTDYRVWCLEMLQTHFRRLDSRDQERLNSLFADTGDLSVLSDGEAIDSGMNDRYRLPVLPNEKRSSRSGLLDMLRSQPRN